MLGHFIFLIGAWLLDDQLYDPLRGATLRRQAARVADGLDLSPRLLRWWADRIFKAADDHSIRQAMAIKKHHLDAVGGSQAVNAFQWSKARLSLEHPEMMAAVQRFEADSKFFRSFFVVLAIALLAGFKMSPNWQWPVYVGDVVLLFLAFRRYADQRAKATSQAYWYSITIEAENPNGYRQTVTTEFTHAGGIVLRSTRDGEKCLLVETSREPKQWVLPKGHIETGEAVREAAVREVREETGVWASVEREADVLEFVEKGKQRIVQLYLMNFIEENKPVDRKRKHKWVALSKAAHELKHEESRKILERLYAERTPQPERAYAYAGQGA